MPIRTHPNHPLATPFVVAPPSGMRIRTRLRVSSHDESVLQAVGGYLGQLSGQDLADRCRLGSAPTERTRRKRELTAVSSSRWAGAITRTTEDQWQRGWRNLLDQQTSLQQVVRKIRRRLTAPVGQRQGKTRGYATRAERYAKQQRLQHLRARLAVVETRLQQGRVSVARGGRQLL